MALKMTLPTKIELEASIESTRAEMKSLPIDARSGSSEFSAYKTAERRKELNLFGPLGLPLPEAYVQIKSVAFEQSIATIHAAIFVTEDARHARENSIHEFAFNLPLPESINGSPLAWAYAQVKALPEFAGAEDV